MSEHVYYAMTKKSVNYTRFMVITILTMLIVKILVTCIIYQIHVMS